MGAIGLRGLTKRYEAQDPPAVDDLHLDVRDGELLALVGPSGCGKTTVLRLIAGLEVPTTGTVEFDGTDVTAWPTRDRDLAMVFQDAGLLSHLTVRRNIGFPLRLRRRSAQEETQRVTAAARVLGIEQLLELRPHRLAMGERQAAATARELTRVPVAFLLDEPLANLDAHRRAVFRREIALLQRGYGATMVYATNDPVDAVALAGRIAVLDGGRLRQVGAPAEVHDRPADTVVAGVVGSPPMNLLPGRVAVEAGPGEVRVRGGGAVPAGWAARWAGRDVLVGIRPQRLTVEPDLRSLRLRVIVGHIASTGSEVTVTGCTGDGAEVVAVLPAPPPAPAVRRGEVLDLYAAVDELHLFDAATGGALRP